MFNADDVYLDIDVKDIFSKISEYDIFKFYCHNFTEINKPFTSEFYDDHHPSCRIYQKGNNSLAYKDFGEGDHLSCFEYVCKKYGCTFKESLRIIANDFGIFNTKNINFKPQFILGKENIPKTENNAFKSVISIVPRGWNYIDYQYWGQFGISFDKLEEYDVIPCEFVYLHKKDKTSVFKHSKYNPIYAYRFINDGKYYYKIYFPLHPDKNRKWLFSGSSTIIEGFDVLPLSGELLIISKSLKDCICYNILGYNAISLQGEANKLEVDLVDKLLKRFDRIIVQYDNDVQGIKSSDKIHKDYGFNQVFIPKESGCKDLAEYIKKYGIEKSKELLNDIIK